jgi:hypothetical protein
MTFSEISNIRLISQNITEHEFKTVKEIVSGMAAIQAQDYSMAKWAISTRLTGVTDKVIGSSIDKGEIIRIHVLRPTWHFIAADDVYWMLQLSSSKIKASLRSRHNQLGLTASVTAKAIDIIQKKITNGLSLTREELANEFHKAKIKTEANRLSHILFVAEMEGVICSGPIKNNKQTYSLLYERVPHKKELSRDESLAELGKRYFSSRYPATLEDFIWWSNLSVSDARKALEMVRSWFFSETIDGVRYLVPDSYQGGALKNASAHLLPAYDEFLISYKNRSSSLSLINNKKTVSDNGIFHPSIVVNGQVTGLWRRTFQKDKVIVETYFFHPPDPMTRNLIDKKALEFGQFLGKETEVISKSD